MKLKKLTKLKNKILCWFDSHKCVVHYYEITSYPNRGGVEYKTNVHVTECIHCGQTSIFDKDAYPHPMNVSLESYIGNKSMLYGPHMAKMTKKGT